MTQDLEAFVEKIVGEVGKNVVSDWRIRARKDHEYHKWTHMAVHEYELHYVVQKYSALSETKRNKLIARNKAGQEI